MAAFGDTGKVHPAIRTAISSCNNETHQAAMTALPSLRAAIADVYYNTPRENYKYAVFDENDPDGSHWDIPPETPS